MSQVIVLLAFKMIWKFECSIFKPLALRMGYPVLFLLRYTHPSIRACYVYTYDFPMMMNHEDNGTAQMRMWRLTLNVALLSSRPTN